MGCCGLLRLVDSRSARQGVLHDVRVVFRCECRPQGLRDDTTPKVFESTPSTSLGTTRDLGSLVGLKKWSKGSTQSKLWS
ncbi:hypothetical protein Nepgr_030507 [Nepenthes gracilis]|uniref:Uncharacterized protein n=1 Tax=Nepenthes gracilis TaxID=150966 RepID=A0AAD3Y647_NEPGR|nr:hypothetical protein Nepgr_030507 [Nepenthes gracilis]